MRIHNPVYGLVGSIIHIPRVQYMCVNYVFCVVCYFWMTHDGRWYCQTICGRPDVARVTQLLENDERLRLVDHRLYLLPSVVG